jgi:light-regulated signal transduction histidine kinase (bacteriophytochrome)
MLAMMLVSDFTERQRAEDEVRRLNAELEDRVAARTEELKAAVQDLEAFSYSVSHDLRAPLRAIDGFSQMLLDEHGGALPEDGRRYIGIVRETTQRMGQLIDDLLAFSRLGRLSLTRRTVDMNQLVAHVREQLVAQEAGRTVAWQVADLPPCEGDLAMLRQVWINLLSNALKYSRRREIARIEVGYTQEHGKPEYFVRDNGTGFDMQYAHKLFGVFERLHRAEEFEGSGVGLAIVQRILHRHDGDVRAESVPDQGATFYFHVG